MTKELNNLIPEQPLVVQDVETDGEIKFVSSPEALAAADAAIAAIGALNFSGRNRNLGKMVNCQVCRRRHRETDPAYREHVDENGKKTVTVDPLITRCKQVFKQLWVDEDVETGELSIQYATVPLPDQNPGLKAIVGAAAFAKKRKNPHPSRRKLQFVRLVRKLVPDEYTEDELKDAREMAAELLGLNKTIPEKYAHMASKEYRLAQKAKQEAKNGTDTQTDAARSVAE